MRDYAADIVALVKAKNPAEPEFRQAVLEVVESTALVIERHPEYRHAKIMERLVEPERDHMLREAVHELRAAVELRHVLDRSGIGLSARRPGGLIVTPGVGEVHYHHVAGDGPRPRLVLLGRGLSFASDYVAVGADSPVHGHLLPGDKSRLIGSQEHVQPRTVFRRTLSVAKWGLS